MSSYRIPLSQRHACFFSRAVLFVADVFHPFDDFAVERLLNRDVRHGRGRRGAMPMLFLRWAPDHVARPYFHFWTAFALHPPTPVRDDQGLPKRVGVPCRASAGLEGDTRATGACRIRCFEQGIDTYSAGKILCRPFAGRLRAASSHIHCYTPYLIEAVAYLLTADEENIAVAAACD